MEKISKVLENSSEYITIGDVTLLKYSSDNKDKSIAWLNKQIVDYCEKTYKKYGFSRGINNIINVNGFDIKTEYISKLTNNYTVFKRVILDHNLKSSDEFYDFYVNNLDKICNTQSQYFRNVVLPILVNTSKKGKMYEIKSLDFFKSELSKKNINVSFIEPTIQEDISGIDGKFIWNDKTITIQVKPFLTSETKENEIWYKTQGSVLINTDYLILYKIEPEEYHIIRVRDMRVDGSYFVTNL